MNTIKTKSIENLEQKMQDIDQGSLRYHILESAKSFKTSWIDLGRALYSVWKDKLYKEWGYSTFDIYTVKEIGIRKQTAVKLLKSYSFLEKEEPMYLEKDYTISQNAAGIPSFESVDVLRQAKNKKDLDEESYGELRKNVFEKGSDAADVKRSLSVMIRQREELSPEEAWEKKRNATVKRFLGTLKALKQEIELSKLLPAGIIQEAARLISKLETQIDEEID
ncbi:MAG: hypothetical protein V2A64_03330 [Candidatus Omnitrophota bacterium]